jgi:hypothetical protein
MSKFIEIKSRLERAILAETALEWLREYGPKHDATARDVISASVHQNHASACGGAKEAKVYLEAAIQEKFAEISRLAIEMAQRDIDTATVSLQGREGIET